MRHCEPACRQVDIAQPAIIPKQLSVTFWNFKSCKFQLSVRFSPTVRHHTKFREDRSNRYGDMVDFRFSKWRPAAMLDF